jgi:hypothetical protein
MARRKNPFTDETDAFLRKWDKLAPALKSQILMAVDSGMTSSQAVRSVLLRNGLKDKLREWFSDVQINAVQVGMGDRLSLKEPLAVRRWFLNEHFQGDDLSLSQRVTRLDLQRDVISTVQANLSAAKGVTRLASELKDSTTVEDLRAGIRELESAARQVMAGDVEAFQEFKRILKRERSYAESTLDGGNETVLQRAYVRVVNAAERLNERGLDRAIENAIDKKARSNAFRIAHNEAARAYGVGVRTRADADLDCTGIEWDLSSGEGHCDECEELDGKVFAKDDLPEYPAHPNCECNLSLYYGPESSLEEHGQDTNDTMLPEELVGDGEE